MLFFKDIALANLVESYKARFKLDPNGEGYLFFKDDFGKGAKCSTAQYLEYTNEFETFVLTKSRFMFWWFVILLVLASLILFYMVFELDMKEFLNDNAQRVKMLGGLFMLLPLIFFLPQGWKLYKKPSHELQNHDIGRERQSKEMIQNKRMRGMSYALPVLGVLVSLLGLYFDRYDVAGGYDSKYMTLLFMMMLFFNLWLWIKKYQAHRADGN